MNPRPIPAIIVTVLTVALLAVAWAEERPATLSDVVRAHPQLTSLHDLLEPTGMLASLERPGRFTFFAPANSAWDGIDPNVMRDVRRDRGALDTLIRHHLLIGASSREALARLDAVTTFQTTRLPIQRRSGEVRVDGARLLDGPISTGNGVVYVVDRVLVPGGPYMLKDMLAGPRR